MIHQVVQEAEPVAHTILDVLGVAFTALAGVLSVIWWEIRSVRSLVLESMGRKSK